MTRRILVLAVVATVALAGCGGAPGTTTAPDDSDSTAVSGEKVPGVTNGSLVDAAALARANEDALSDTGGVVELTRSEGSSEATYRLVAGAGFSTYSLSGSRTTAEGESVGVDLWGNETDRLVRTTAGGEPDYRVGERRETELPGLDRLRAYLAAGDYEVVDGTTANGSVVLRADEFTPPADDRSALGDVSSFSGRVVVGESGLVRNLTVSGTDGGESFAYRYDLRRTGVERVGAPDWTESVPPSATLDVRLDVRVRNSSYLLVENAGGDTVPADTTVDLTVDGTTTEATFETPLEVGESRYLYVDAADGTATLSDDRPAPDALDPLTSPVSVIVATADGATLHSGGMAWESASASENGSEAGNGNTGATGSAGGSDRGEETATPTTTG